MAMNLDEIAALSRAVVLQHGRGSIVSTVLATEGGTDRVEVIVTVEGCHSGPCRFAVNVTRASDPDFRREFEQKLAKALDKHADA
jgi:hypothetical protein